MNEGNPSIALYNMLMNSINYVTMAVTNKMYNDFPMFLTMTVVGWIKIFENPLYSKVIVDSLGYCQRTKGLKIHAWCLMPNHLHLIVSSQSLLLSSIVRDFKKYTSKSIITELKQSAAIPDHRLLMRFEQAASKENRSTNYKFWQTGNEAKTLETNHFTNQKLNYIHKNPVKAGLVKEPEDYPLSSARDYSGVNGLLDICHLD